MRKLLVAVGVVSSLGLAGSALARPWDRDNPPPPNTVRPEISLRVANDGRADQQLDRSGHQDPYARTDSKPAPDRSYGQERHGAPIPLKADIQMKMQHGDNREGGSALSKSAQSMNTSNANDSLYGRKAPAAPIPLKSQIALRMQNGDNRDGGSSKGAAERPADQSGKGAHKAWQTKNDREHGMKQPLSRDQKDAVCKHTGICLPTLTGSDNSDDKSE